MAGLTRAQRAERAAARAETGVDETPRIAVLERRLQNPFGAPAVAIRLKNPQLFPRWFNSALQHDRFYIAAESGWMGVKPDDVLDKKQISGFSRSPDGYVARGARGEEVLMCIEKSFWDRLQLAKTRKNLEMMRDQKGEQSRALDAAAAKLGPQVAEQMEAVSRQMTVTDTYERIEKLETE